MNKQHIKTINIQGDWTVMSNPIVSIDSNGNGKWVDLPKGLYKGEITSSGLISIPVASLTEAISYYIDGSFYVWDADATTGAFEPNDKNNPGVDPGYWVLVGGAGGLQPFNFLQENSNYTITDTDPLVIEVDTSSGDLTLTLPQISEGGNLYIKNLGPNNLTLISASGETVKNNSTFQMIDGSYYHFMSDVNNLNWVDVMKESIFNGVQNYFFGFYTILGPSGTFDNGKLYLDIINLSSSTIIEYSKYNIKYIMEDGGGIVTHTISGNLLINNVSDAGIEVTL